MNLKKSLLIALSLGLAAITSWEIYWRSKGYTPGLEDNKELWAVQRSRVDHASDKDVVLIGDSRMLFDLQLKAWENETGSRPIQLASAGTTPLPVFHDIVENTDFQGTILMSVTPDIFFTSVSEEDDCWYRIKARIDHYHERTYADRLNHILDIPIQQNLTFLRNDEEAWTDDLNLKNLLDNIRIGDRGVEPLPPFYRFMDIGLDRNVELYPKTSIDKAFANSIINIWMMDIESMTEESGKIEVVHFFKEDLERFQAKGGQLILIRFPSSGNYRTEEELKFPRNKFYETLVKTADVPAYHFEDFDQLNQFYCPEWSHLSAEDARTFTTELARLLIKDQVISN